MRNTQDPTTLCKNYLLIIYDVSVHLIRETLPLLAVWIPGFEVKKHESLYNNILKDCIYVFYTVYICLCIDVLTVICFTFVVFSRLF